MNEEFIFYFGEQFVYSHWFKCDFKIDNLNFCCVEQYIMHQKAILFNDDEIAKRILNSSDPARHKHLGKRVSGFNKEIWHRYCKQFSFKGNIAKFSQQDELRKVLIQSVGKSFAEASPYDRIWGIGLSMSNPKIYDRLQWRGRNWAGEVLESVRTELLK